MRRPFLPLLCALLFACGREVEAPEPEASALPPATFAAVVAELALARAELLPDTAAYLARREAILARYGVTAAELRAFGAGYGGNEDVVSRVYEAVAARIDTTFGAGATAPPSTGVAPPEESEPESEPLAEPAFTVPDTAVTAPDSA